MHKMKYNIKEESNIPCQRQGNGSVYFNLNNRDTHNIQTAAQNAMIM